MKLILVLALLALVGIARSAPPSSSKDRTLVLPSYDADDEEDVITQRTESSEEDWNTTTTTTTTTAATRRSTYVFPTRARPTPSARRPWLTQRTTTVDESEIDIDNIDLNQYEPGLKIFKNIREFFKRLMDDVKKFLRKITNIDIFKIIKQFFIGRSDD